MGEVFRAVAEIHHAPAAVVERPRVDAGRDLEEVAPVAARLNRHLALELARNVQHVARLADLEHRRLAGDRDRFLQRPDLHHDVDLKVRAGAQQDIRAPVGRKPGQLGRNGVRARRQVDETVRSVSLRNRRRRLEERGAGGRNGDTGQRAALLVFHVPTQAALGLRQRGRRDEKLEREGESQTCADHRDLRKVEKS